MAIVYELDWKVHIRIVMVIGTYVIGLDDWVDSKVQWRVDGWKRNWVMYGLSGMGRCMEWHSTLLILFKLFIGWWAMWRITIETCRQIRQRWRVRWWYYWWERWNCNWWNDKRSTHTLRLMMWRRLTSVSFSVVFILVVFSTYSL